MRDVAVVKLTSGSTGAPRGVAIGVEAQLADATAFAHEHGPAAAGSLPGRDPDVACLRLHHPRALRAGPRIDALVLPAEWGPFPPLEAGEALGATVFPTVPAYVQGVLKMARPPRAAEPGAARHRGRRGASQRGRRRASDAHYGQPVHVLYGASECGGICYDREGGAAERGTVGTPLDRQPDLDRAAPTDAQGEEGVVVVESPSVGDRLSARSRSVASSSGRFETSDVGVWRNGELVVAAPGGSRHQRARSQGRSLRGRRHAGRPQRGRGGGRGRRDGSRARRADRARRGRLPVGSPRSRRRPGLVPPATRRAQGAAQRRHRRRHPANRHAAKSIAPL